MKNFEKYKDYLIKAIAVCNSDELLELAGIECNMVDYYGTKKSLVNWLLQDYKEPILDDGERKYLSEAIRPFRHRVESIAKCTNSGMYQIVIYFKDTKTWWFPLFPRESSMYKGMQTFKYYSLKELGL